MWPNKKASQRRNKQKKRQSKTIKFVFKIPTEIKLKRMRSTGHILKIGNKKTTQFTHVRNWVTELINL